MSKQADKTNKAALPKTAKKQTTPVRQQVPVDNHLLQLAREDPTHLTPTQRTQLQRSLGNRALSQLVDEQSLVNGKQKENTQQSTMSTPSPPHSITPSPPHLHIQPKLTVNAVGDKYEQEADAVASKVVQQLNSPQPMQREAAEEEEMAMPKHDITVMRDAVEDEEMMPQLVQRQEVPEEEMQLQRQEAEDEELQLQRQEIEDEEMMAQRQEMPEEDEMQLQRQEVAEDEEMQLQRQVPEEEEQPQNGAMAQRQPQDFTQGGTVDSSIEAQINQSRGGGQPMDASIRQPMEQAFGADFSDVRIHTDNQAHDLNESIQARAFTTGHDIYFKEDEYSPYNSNGKELIAHELTHVVQQSQQTTLDLNPLNSSVGSDKSVNIINRQGTSTLSSKSKKKPTVIVLQGIKDILEGNDINKVLATVQAKVFIPTIYKRAIWDFYKGKNGIDFKNGEKIKANGYQRSYWIEAGKSRISSIIDFAKSTIPEMESTLQIIDSQIKLLEDLSVQESVTDEDRAEFKSLSGKVVNEKNEKFKDVEEYIAYRDKYFGGREQYNSIKNIADQEWNNNSIIRRRIGEGGDSKARKKALYIWLRYEYQKIGYDSVDDIVDLLKAGMSSELDAKVSSLKNNFPNLKTGGFVPRPKKRTGLGYRLGTLSEHGTGKAIDIKPQNDNPQIPAGVWRTIENIAGQQVNRKKERWINDPATLWQEVNDLNNNYQEEIRRRVENVRQARISNGQDPDNPNPLTAILDGWLLARALSRGLSFFTLPRDLIMELHDEDLIWGVTFTTPDLHHFEL